MSLLLQEKKKYPHRSVCVILFDAQKEQVLLIKRRDIPVWVLPGGKIDLGETPEQAACREVLEETGCRVKVVRKIAEYLPVNCFTHFTYFFECVIENESLSIGAETLAIQFFPLNLLPRDLAPPYLLWIQDACFFYPYTLKKKIEGVSYLLFLKLLVLHPFLVCRFLLTKCNIHLNKKSA